VPKILLVEDNDWNAEIVIRCLANHVVVRVADGPRAVSFCSSERPDLILMDMTLLSPENGTADPKAGHNATREIRALPGMQTVPIIAYTGRDMPHERAEMYQAGISDILLKPFNFEDLEAKIRYFVKTGQT
jgi:CheY-like chemotaxis protein